MGATKKTIEKTSKRAPSSYVLFSIEHRKHLAKEHPNTNLGDISKMCGAAWRTMSDEEKEPWKLKSEEQRLKLSEQKQELLSNNPPKKKRAPSSYVLFSMEHRRNIVAQNPSLSLGQVSKECGAAWQKLSDEEKQPWILKSKHLLEEMEGVADA